MRTTTATTTTDGDAYEDDYEMKDSKGGGLRYAAPGRERTGIWLEYRTQVRKKAKHTYCYTAVLLIVASAAAASRSRLVLMQSTRLHMYWYLRII